MAHMNLEEDRAKYTALFKQIDTDESGTVSLDEFSSMMKANGYKYTDEQIKVV